MLELNGTKKEQTTKKRKCMMGSGRCREGSVPRVRARAGTHAVGMEKNAGSLLAAAHVVNTAPPVYAAACPGTGPHGLSGGQAGKIISPPVACAIINTRDCSSSVAEKTAIPGSVWRDWVPRIRAPERVVGGSAY